MGRAVIRAQSCAPRLSSHRAAYMPSPAARSRKVRQQAHRRHDRFSRLSARSLYRRRAAGRAPPPPPSPPSPPPLPAFESSPPIVSMMKRGKMYTNTCAGRTGFAAVAAPRPRWQHRWRRCPHLPAPARWPRHRTHRLARCAAGKGASRAPGRTAARPLVREAHRRARLEDHLIESGRGRLPAPAGTTGR